MYIYTLYICVYIYTIYVYTYIYTLYVYTHTHYICEPGPRTPTPPSPPMVSPPLLTPPPAPKPSICMLFAHIHTHIHIYTSLSTPPNLASLRYLQHLRATTSSTDLVYLYISIITFFLEPPIACLAHGLQHICYLWITQSLPMQT